MLITEYVGFRFAYVRELWTRMCRASVPAEAEAAAIMMVHPSAVIGYARYGYWETPREVRDVKGVARTLIRAVVVYLPLANKKYNFNVVKPVSDDDPRCRMPHKGQHMQCMLDDALPNLFVYNAKRALR